MFGNKGGQEKEREIRSVMQKPCDKMYDNQNTIFMLLIRTRFTARLNMTPVKL